MRRFLKCVDEIGAVSLILIMTGRFERIHGGLYRFSKHRHMIDH